MDPELQKKIDEARANGYSEEEIQSYLQGLKTPTPAEQAAATGQPVPTVENLDRSAEYTGLAQGAGLEVAKTALELYAGKKLILDPLLNKFGPKPPPAAPAPSVAVPQQAAIPQQQVVNGPAQPGAADNRVRFPTNQATGSPAPAAQQQPGIMQRGMDYARQMRQIAADKVMQGARAVAPAAEAVASGARAIAAPAAVGLTAALMPGNAGTNYPFPQKGPYRGMEINPMTGRPWTPQELAQYR